jgi:hypothetical protein
MKLGNEGFYIDLDQVDKIISLNSFADPGTYTETETTTAKDENGKTLHTTIFEKKIPRSKEIDSIRYDTIKMMLDQIFNEVEEIDGSLGLERAIDNTSLSFKIAFNTLTNLSIIKEK